MLPRYENPDFVWNLGEEDESKVEELEPLKNTPKRQITSNQARSVQEVLSTQEDSDELVSEEQMKAFTPDFNAPIASTVAD